MVSTITGLDLAYEFESYLIDTDCAQHIILNHYLRVDSLKQALPNEYFLLVIEYLVHDTKASKTLLTVGRLSWSVVCSANMLRWL